jgi:hypothetical protein
MLYVMLSCTVLAPTHLTVLHASVDSSICTGCTYEALMEGMSIVHLVLVLVMHPLHDASSACACTT